MMKFDFVDAAAFVAAVILIGALAFGKPAQSASLDAPVRVLRVTDDPGGFIRDYAYTIGWLDERGYTVELAGDCYSACTLFTMTPSTCVVEGAVLWFHAPFEIDGATGQIVTDPASTKIATESYPADIQKWIAAQGGLPNPPDWLILKGQELYDLVPLCGAEVPTS